jgi:hypothetical protein
VKSSDPATTVNECEPIMPKARLSGQPAGSAAFVEAMIWFAMGAVPTLLLATLFSALGKVGFFPPILIFGPLFAGLALMGLLAVSRERAWFFKTRIARQWIGLFGESVGGIVLRLMLVFMLVVGVGVAFVPLIAPAKQAEVGPQPAAGNAGGAAARQPPQGGALPPAPQMPATAGLNAGDPRFVPAALKDLRSGNRDHQISALSGIQGLWGQRGEAPAELRAEIAKLTEVDESFLAGMAVRTLGVVGGAGELPALEKALARAKEKNDFGMKVACEQVIEQIKTRK